MDDVFASHINPETFDYASFRKRMLDDDEIILKIISGILDRMPKMIGELKEYIDGKDVENAGRLAHTIKGAAANMGCDLLRRAALSIESASESGKIDKIKPLFPILENEWTQLEPILHNFII